MSSFYPRKYRSIEATVGPAYWPVLGWTSLLALLQTSVMPLLAFRGAVPSLVTIAVVLFALRVGARRGALLGLPAGLLEDIFAGTAGGWTISTTIVAMLVGGLSRRMFADGTFVPAVTCGVAVLVRDLLFWGVMRAEGFPQGFALSHLHTSLWRALLTAMLAYLWLLIRSRIAGDKAGVVRYGFE
ncbi:MAG TPA: rod shape-determining protein MreD [Candidatus Elarobacter sp.]|jgi:rod shape-determining protein MreD|nr:rod shape-determining protein MreD [Candidatus Elarobacter sp.]